MTSCSCSYQAFVPSTDAEDPDRDAFGWLLSRVNDAQAVRDAMEYYVPPNKSWAVDLRWFWVQLFADRFRLKVPSVTARDWRSLRIGGSRKAVLKKLLDPCWFLDAAEVDTPFAIVETLAIPRDVVACYDFR